MAQLIPYEILNGRENMLIDEQLLNTAINKGIEEPILRLYGWSPSCVSLGRNQKSGNINYDYCKENKINIVKRITGGRALLHENEITYSFICPTNFLKNGESIIHSYKEISGALIKAFNSLGINLSFPEQKKAATKFEYCMSISTGADLSFNNKKVIGSAQCRKQNFILQHGSILFDYDAEKIIKIFGERPDKAQITTVKELNPKVTKEQLCEAIKSGFEQYFQINFL